MGKHQTMTSQWIGKKKKGKKNLSGKYKGLLGPNKANPRRLMTGQLSHQLQYQHALLLWQLLFRSSPKNSITIFILQFYSFKIQIQANKTINKFRNYIYIKTSH